MYRTTIDRNKWSLEKQKFYKDLRKVESSLGRSEQRRSNSGLMTKPESRVTHDRPIDTFKKELNRKELTKTKIKLDAPYEKHGMGRARKQQEGSYSREDTGVGEEKNSQLYDNVRSKLLSWKREEEQQAFNRTEKAEDLHKILAGLSTHQSAKNFEMAQPAAQLPISQTTRQLLSQLTKRQEVYKVVEEGLGGRKVTDISISLQQHFREHRLMAEIIDQFKEIIGWNKQFSYAEVKQLLDDSRLESESSMMQPETPPRH